MELYTMAAHLRRAAEAAAATHDPDCLIDAAVACGLCGGISDMTLRRWVSRGIIPAPQHIERRRFWRRGELLAALAAHQEAAPPSPAPNGPPPRAPAVDAA
jgi:hypothetical protein